MKRGAVQPLVVVLALLAVAVLVPYWQLLTMQAIVVTDDRFVSDAFGGELPARVWAGAILRSGRVPLWCDDLFGGLAAPLFDPVSLALFAWLSPAVAMNVQVVFVLLTAAFGTYAWLRRLGAAQWPASLGAMAFTHSGSSSAS